MGSYKCHYIAVILTLEVLAFLAFAAGGCYGNTDVRIILGVYLFFTNLFTASIFWTDKFLAASDNNQHRVPELVLHLTVIFGGPVGALFGMYCCCCRHKTNKNDFLCIAFCCIIFNFAWVIVALIATAKDTLPFCYNNN